MKTENKSSEFVVVYSTLSVDQTYMHSEKLNDAHDKAALEKMQVIDKFIIRGGANIADFHGGQKIITPNGVANNVPRSVYENVLLKSPVFEQHVKNGYILVDETNSLNLDKAVSDMSKKDKSSQALDEDVKNLEKSVEIKVD